MGQRFNAPPGWPPPPPGWAPPLWWHPEPDWPPAPPGWQFWVDVPGDDEPEPLTNGYGHVDENDHEPHPWDRPGTPAADTSDTSGTTATGTTPLDAPLPPPTPAPANAPPPPHAPPPPSAYPAAPTEAGSAQPTPDASPYPPMPAAAQADDAATGAGAPDAAVGKQRIWRRRPLRRLPVRRVILLVVAALVALFLIVSLVAALARALQRDQTQSVQTPATSAGRVAIENDCGSISLREGTSEVVSVQSTIHFLLTKPKLTSQLEGDVVVVAVDCPRFGFGATADLVVDLPPLGAVEVTANSGDIAAEDVSASLSLNSSAGEISAVGLRATAVSAESSAGGVSLTWAEDADPRTIKAISSAGEVNILVPERLGVSYQVNATTAAGDATVDVRTDDSADRTIHATSSAGSVHVGYR